MLDFHNWQMAAFLYCTAGSIYCTYNNSEIGSELFFYFYLQHTNRCLKIMRGDKTNSPSSDNYNYIRLRFFGSAASICSVLLPALHGRDLPGRLRWLLHGRSRPCCCPSLSWIRIRASYCYDFSKHRSGFLPFSTM
jgi:hypothetical protein